MRVHDNQNREEPLILRIMKPCEVENYTWESKERINLAQA
jgi:hypothetical protein